MSLNVVRVRKTINSKVYTLRDTNKFTYVIQLHRVLVGKPEGKRPLGRPRHRWEDNIKMDLEEVGGSCGDWMELAQDRDRWWAVVGTVTNLRVPKMRGIS